MARARRSRPPPVDIELVRVEPSLDGVGDAVSGDAETRVVVRRPGRSLFVALGIVGLLAVGLGRFSDTVSHLPKRHVGPPRPPVELAMTTPPPPVTTVTSLPPTPPTTARPVPPARPSPGCASPTRSQAPGLSEVALVSGGEPRRYLRTVPDGDEEAPAPLVVVLDDGSGDPGLFVDRARWPAIAQLEHLVLAAPRWTRTDDDQFVADATVDVGLTTCVDLARVYLAGFSTGATLGTRVVCGHPGLIAAFVAVAGSPAPDRCPADLRVPVLVVHGAIDEIVSPTSVGEAAKAWARQDGCRPDPSSSMAGWNIQFYEYQHCTDAVVVHLYLLADMGHEWPEPVLDASDATRWADLMDTTAIAVAFCEKYAR